MITDVQLAMFRYASNFLVVTVGFGWARSGEEWCSPSALHLTLKSLLEKCSCTEQGVASNRIHIRKAR